MDIQTKKEKDTLYITLEGRFDTTNAPKLEAVLKKEIGDIKELVFDFAGIEYISSAGLRVLLAAQKVMNRQGIMKLRNVGEMVMDVFEVTGFSEILTIEE